MEDNNGHQSGYKNGRRLGRDFWDNNWLSGRTGWDIGHASPPITEYMHQYQNKDASILIPGCGNAYEVEFLADNGYTDITLLDISPVAVKIASSKFKHLTQIKIICENFFKYQGKHDLIIEQTFFSAILPEQRTEYVKHAHSLLNDNGKIIGVLFDRTFPHQGPPFGGNSFEYKSLFEPLFDIRVMDTCYNSIPPRADSEVFIHLIKK